MNEEIEDRLILYETSLKEAKKQKDLLIKFTEKIAGIMNELKTDTVKQELAEVTQNNYKKMIELEMEIALAEEALEYFKKIKRLFE